MREGRRGAVAEPEGVCGGEGGGGRKSSAFSKWKLCFILSFLRLDVSHQSLSSSASSTSHLSPPSRCIHHLPRPPPSRSSAAFHSLRGLAAAFFSGRVLRPLDGIFRSECVSPPPHPNSPPCLESLARQPSSLLISRCGAVRLDRSINHTSVECQKQASEAQSLQRDHRCSSEPWLPVRVPSSVRLFQAG